MVKRFLIAVVVALGAAGGLLWAADGPLTPLFNLKGRTDASGYLRVSGGAYSGADGPLTALGNLRGRTDANGYLRVSLAGGDMTGIVTTSVNGIATTSSDGMVLQNATAATSGVPVQMSPRMKLRGTAWDTAASQTVDFFTETLPESAATPTGVWKLGYSLNGAAATYPMTVTSAGTATVLQGFTTGALGCLTYTGSGFLCGANGSGLFTLRKLDVASGVTFNVSALPTVSAGCGTSPAVIAGSTPLAGSVNVGTGGTATTCTIAFGGTAFPSAPFCTYSNSTSNVVTRGTPTASTLVLNTTTAWGASDIVTWICISSK